MSRRHQPKCPHCSGYGYVQKYRQVVYRDFCDCPAGDSRVEERLKIIMELGLDINTLPRKDRYLAHLGRVERTSNPSEEKSD